jgi:hypothetical protein
MLFFIFFIGALWLWTFIMHYFFGVEIWFTSFFKYNAFVVEKKYGSLLLGHYY